MASAANNRTRLLEAAQSFCDSFASQKDILTILSHFSTSEPEAFEHGESFLAPFLGRKFVGLEAIQTYFELLEKHITYRNMHFPEYTVDVEEKRVAAKGEAEFTWIATNQTWDETFAYTLEFDEKDKVKKYHVWADSGAVYLAKIGELDEKRQEHC